MQMELTPSKTTTIFLGLDDVCDVKTKVATFEVTDGKAGFKRTS